ncbi:MAG: hypothetical protein JWR42_2671 [Marmoricola sp.]|nr:hypothetical protein [Marmoricola sp.]
MQKRHVVPLVLLAFVIVVGGIMLIIGSQKAPDTGIDTSRPNGSGPVTTLSVP